MTPEERDAIESGTYQDYLRREIERLMHGIREISRFLDANRMGDASFVCAALLVGDEQMAESK
jgi:hypothetical protein